MANDFEDKSVGTTSQIQPNNNDNITSVNGANVNTVAKKWQGTITDKKEMRTLGRLQELRRNFRFLSTFGLNCTLIATWEVVITSLAVPLTNGGTAGMLWGYIIAFICFWPVYLSLAEMASMAPTSGGQYHWVSEFAPPKAQKVLSYMVGWLSFTSWQAGVAFVAFFPGTIIQGLIELNDPTYVYHRWHGTLLMIAVVVFAVAFNTLFAKKLPLVESLLLILYVVGFFAIIITLWILAPLGDSKEIWFTFANGGGWNSNGTATMVGIISAVATLLGFDCSVHMAEEVKNASSIVPKAMLWSVLFNGCLGLLMTLTLAYTLGDIDTILKTPTGYPFIQIFLDTTKSFAATNILTIIILLVELSGIIAEMATASRQLWSFARDRGMPGHRWIARVHRTYDIPLNAVIVSILVTALISLLNIASTAALNAVLSLAGVAFLTSYMISIGCILWKRIRGETLPPSRFSLGRWGMLCNILAICFLAPISVFAFFPPTTPTTAEGMNWAVVIYVGILVFAAIWYAIRGRHEYQPPVILVKREIDGYLEE